MLCVLVTYVVQLQSVFKKKTFWFQYPTFKPVLTVLHKNHASNKTGVSFAIKAQSEVLLNLLVTLILCFMQPSLYKKRKRTDEHAYKEWKSTVMESNNKDKETGNERLPVTYVFFNSQLIRLIQLTKKVLWFLQFLLSAPSKLNSIFGSWFLKLRLGQCEMHLVYQTYFGSCCKRFWEGNDKGVGGWRFL